MENIQRITENLRGDFYISNPHNAAADLAILAGEYAYMTNQLSSILESKPSIWIELRKAVKSDTACERAWQNTPNGIKETTFKLQLKSVEKMMSSIRTLVRMAEVEAKNIL